MKVGIIAGSIREGRNATGVAQWVLDQSAKVEGAEFEVIDLGEYNVPLLTAPVPPGAANKQYDDENVTRWSQAIDACDAFVFVTPEYNHGVPGAFKNAFDSLGSEWTGKPVAFVSYGADNGIRAVEQWRQIISNFHMHDVRTQVALNLFNDFSENGAAPAARHEDTIADMFGQLLKAAS